MMPKSTETLFLIIPILVFLYSGTARASGMVDLVYADHISGVVVDEEGQPVDSATVWRVDSVNEAEEGPPAKGQYRYKHPMGETDEKGCFAFNDSDTTGWIEKEEIWMIAVSHPGFKTQVTTVKVLWYPDPDKLWQYEADNPEKEWGYILHDIRIVLEHEEVEPSDKESSLPVE